MTSPDNWGHAARIGLFIVAGEAVPEAEWWAMCPPGVSVHAARVMAPAPWAIWREGRAGEELERAKVTLSPDVLRGCSAFLALKPAVAVLAHSSSSFVGGPGWDEATIAALSAELSPGTLATTNGLDMRLALSALGAARPFLVMPAWMSDRLVEAAQGYFAAHGFAVQAAWRHEPAARWRWIAPQDLYSHGMAIDQETGTLFEQVCDNCPPEADSIVLAGTGLRCVAIIEALEARLQRPVITANQASLWRALKAAGAPKGRDGYGALLRA